MIPRAATALLLLAALPLRAMEPAAALRLPADRITAAEKYSRQAGGQALLITQSGTTLHESYANGGAADRAVPVMSITKNLTALAIFAARAEGRLDLDEPAAKTLKEWRADPRKRRITLRQLLQQTSGLATGYPAIYARSTRDKTRLALTLPAVAEPGARFAYGPANYEILGEILRRNLGGTDPLAFLTVKILAPLGVQPAGWRADRHGTPFYSAGAMLTARDLAKVGDLIRRQGRTSGAWFAPILPASAFREAFTGSSANSMYGLSFWLNANATRPAATTLSIEGTLGTLRTPTEWRDACLSPAAPAELIALIGSGGLRCYILPSRQLVIVRLGSGSRFSDAEFLRRLFENR